MSVKDQKAPYTPHEAERTMAAGEFKAKCLKVLDEVAATRESVIVTKFGKPVARLVPIRSVKSDIIGAMRGSVLWEGDIISPLDVEWDAMK
uniref:Antitoxin n=1 Tax=mine drainage metagenome TaxID=410659 RepID=E6QHX8_9ZZZZ